MKRKPFRIVLWNISARTSSECIQGAKPDELEYFSNSYYVISSNLIIKQHQIMLSLRKSLQSEVRGLKRKGAGFQAGFFCQSFGIDRIFVVFPSIDGEALSQLKRKIRPKRQKVSMVLAIIFKSIQIRYFILLFSMFYIK